MKPYTKAAHDPDSNIEKAVFFLKTNYKDCALLKNRQGYGGIAPF
jgi:hypothetical protein